MSVQIYLYVQNNVNSAYTINEIQISKLKQCLIILLNTQEIFETIIKKFGQKFKNFVKLIKNHVIFKKNFKTLRKYLKNTKRNVKKFR